MSQSFIALRRSVVVFATVSAAVLCLESGSAQTIPDSQRNQTSTTTAPGPTVEDRVKASYLYRFPDYVEFPATVAERPETELCVLRGGPMSTALQDVQNFTQKQNTASRVPKVRTIGPQDAIDSCWLLYVPPSAASSASQVLRKAVALPILTVGESSDFLEQGGLIGLKVVDGRVRFDVAKTAGERAGLRFRLQLLQYALSVK